MRIISYKKIFVILIIILLSTITISLSINAKIIKKGNYENINLEIMNNYVSNYRSYDLLIITSENYSDVLQNLKDHKDSIGISTKISTLDEVYDNMFWNGRDDAEKIKFFIKNAFEEWGIKYVLFVGDFRTIPVRYCHNADIVGFYEPFFISELYYADIYDKNGDFSSWDTNNNGVFGEWLGNIAEDGNIDLYPDIYVGRLACRNIFEVKTMVDKIINYENEISINEEWFNKIVVVGGDTYPESINPDWKGFEGEENNIKVLQNMSDFEAIKLWTSDGSLSGPSDVIKAINNGCGFIYFDGHANPYNWGTHPPNDAEKFVDGLSVLTMSFLRNGEKLPICVVGGCHNLQFDVHLGKLKDEPWYYYTWIPECWGWKLTRKSGGGSIATIGCSGLGMTKEDKESFSGGSDFLEPTFFYEIGVNNTNVLGEAWGKTITDYLNKYPIDWNTPAAWDYAIDAKTVQQWVLLGDPSLRIGGI